MYSMISKIYAGDLWYKGGGGGCMDISYVRKHMGCPDAVHLQYPLPAKVYNIKCCIQMLYYK